MYNNIEISNPGLRGVGIHRAVSVQMTLKRVEISYSAAPVPDRSYHA